MPTMTLEPLVRHLHMSVVEGVRENLSLTIRDFCPLIGCSRQTYYTWKARGQVPDGARKRVRNRLRSLVRIAGEYDLPGPSKERAAIIAGMMVA
jgi:DNA-binding transcriptional regulator YiaG